MTAETQDWRALASRLPDERAVMETKGLDVDVKTASGDLEIKTRIKKSKGLDHRFVRLV